MIERLEAETIDLDLVARKLAVAGEYHRLVDGIRRVRLIQSCLADLAQAADTLEALEWQINSPRGVGTERRAAIENALLSTAVILYCRAASTVGKKGERGSIDIRSRLTPPQLADHEHLTRLRNRAIAHVYTTEDLEGEPWHVEAAFLYQTGGGFKLGVLSNRLQIEPVTVATAARQIPVAHAILRTMFEQREGRLADLLNGSLADPTVLSALASSGFDLGERIGSAGAAVTALAAIDIGEARELTRRRPRR